jgi:hypothetical protein
MIHEADAALRQRQLRRHDHYNGGRVRIWGNAYRSVFPSSKRTHATSRITKPPSPWGLGTAKASFGSPGATNVASAQVPRRVGTHTRSPALNIDEPP